MTWKQAKYGETETLTLAEGRITLVARKKIVDRGGERSYYSQIAADITGASVSSIENAKKQAITLAKKRFKQALEELEAMEAE